MNLLHHYFLKDEGGMCTSLQLLESADLSGFLENTRCPLCDMHLIGNSVFDVAVKNGWVGGKPKSLDDVRRMYVSAREVFEPCCTESGRRRRVGNLQWRTVARYYRIQLHLVLLRYVCMVHGKWARFRMHTFCMSVW